LRFTLTSLLSAFSQIASSLALVLAFSVRSSSTPRLHEATAVAPPGGLEELLVPVDVVGAVAVEPVGVAAVAVELVWLVARVELVAALEPEELLELPQPASIAAASKAGIEA
jgi:hypothetical protein